MWRIAADTGGTFTDCHAIAPDGSVRRVKVLSSGCLRATVGCLADTRSLVLAERRGLPDDFLSGFTLRWIDEAGIPRDGLISGSADSESGCRVEIANRAAGDDSALAAPGSIVEITTGEAAPVLGARLLTLTPPGRSFPPIQFRLATTRATNALLEHTGSRVAFFVTRGFGDLLLIGDQRRKHLFALQHHAREVHYESACEVDERLDARGGILSPLDDAAVHRDAAALVRQGTTSAAVTLLHSDVNPAHEHRVRDILRAAGFSHVSLGSELAPFVRILPRAQCTVANAYLTGPVEQWIRDVQAPLMQHHSTTPSLRPPSKLSLMTSAGSLETADGIRPKDLLLSGPAGGVLGALNAARRMGFDRIISFDMGGTSTDVARVDGALPFRFEHSVGGITLVSPAVAVESVAAGGGSICSWTPAGLVVGPNSAGSDPGPACYGKGGPLTITDVNLLLGRFDPARAPIPLDSAAAESRAGELLRLVNQRTSRGMTLDGLLRGLLALAVGHMADAIRKISILEGYDPAGYALLAFGGAGPQHACDVAQCLGIRLILVPRDAGILSAAGLQEAVPETIAQRQVLRALHEVQNDLPKLLSQLAGEAARQLVDPETGGRAALNFRHIAELRLHGQEAPLQIEFRDAAMLGEEFARRFQQLFGYAPSKEKMVELVTLRVIAKAGDASRNGTCQVPSASNDPGLGRSRSLIEGPSLMQDAFSTLVIANGWTAEVLEGTGWILRCASTAVPATIANQSSAVGSDLMRHRLLGIVEDMGALLRRTALSTNIRERLDFSCALLDAGGRLVISAPHIPVHLGALGVCVREVLKRFPPREGDTVITNHPAFGGSHLPDVTLITPVFDDEHCLLGFVANRAHHAEIGGISPGSMPANARSLIEEGVVISPTLLCRDAAPDFAAIRSLLTKALHPTRAIEDNMADLHAQLAANRLGAERLREVAASVRAIERHSPDSGRNSGEPGRLAPAASGSTAFIRHILDESRQVMLLFLPSIPEGDAEEFLDDGTAIRVRLQKQKHTLLADFSGTSGQHPGNLNATPAIIRSAVLYVLRLAVQDDLPLNEGLLEDVRIILPGGSLLHPRFQDDPALCPAVVGGNVEISQRVVDTLLKALRLQACSQGTMNNFIFGNDRFGYYETICGGSGAGPGYHGASAVHTHMTNTAITDAEVIERRYPVRIREFSIRRGSGGNGKWRGGDGVIREFEFLEPLTVSLLTQHRRTAPFGLNGGGDGSPGRQTLMTDDSRSGDLPSSATFDALPGDRIRIETPGGGGWGLISTQGTTA